MVTNADKWRQNGETLTKCGSNEKVSLSLLFRTGDHNMLVPRCGRFDRFNEKSTSTLKASWIKFFEIIELHRSGYRREHSKEPGL